MQFKDYYQTLGVDRGASADEIKTAFRRLARKYHPDVSKEPDAEQRMQEINEAYTVLSDPERRGAYDQVGRGFQAGQEFHAPPGWEGTVHFAGSGFSPHGAADFSDFFAELFGRRPGGPGFARPRRDHRTRIVLDLEDSLHGATRQLTLTIPRLDASGRISRQERTLNLRIPKGIRPGQTIRLAGQGPADPQGGPPGDLLLEVEFRPHPRFTVDGADLRLRLPIAPWEAALGALVEIPLPDGEVRVRIPEGSRGGRQLRVRGKGLPGNPPGDLLLDLEILLPPADTPEARRHYEAMARDFAFDPRKPRS